MSLRTLGLLIAFCTCCHAAEISAWKVRLSSIIRDDLEESGATRLQQAPEPTVFFSDGDELWDLGTVHDAFGMKTVPPAEWSVWNATTRRLVTKTSLHGLMQLLIQSQQQQAPRYNRLTVRCYPVSNSLAEPSRDTEPLLVISHICRTGEKSSISWSRDECRASIDTECSDIGINDLIQLRLCGSLEIPGQQKLNISTSFTLTGGKQIWIARDFDGQQGMDVALEASIELIDGTPYGEMILLQHDGKPVPHHNPHSLRLSKQRIEPNGWLLIQSCPVDLLAIILEDRQEDPAIDPFADTAQSPPVLLQRFTESIPPESIRRWFPKALIDLREPFRKLGMNLGEDCYAGYDLLTSRLVFLTHSDIEADKFESLFMTLHSGIPQTTVITIEDRGQSRLITQSGEKATMTRTGWNTNAARNMEIQANVGEHNTMADLHYFLEDVSTPGSSIKLNGASTFTIGEWSKIGEFNSSSSTPAAIRVMVEVIELDDHALDQ